MKILKVGIAGYGIVGKKRHVYVDENINAKVVAICDQNFKENNVLKNNIRSFNNYQDLLKEDLDILFVCLPNFLAAEATIKGLEKDFHVFCEKPPGKNVQDIEEVIVMESKKPKLKLKYGFNHRYHDSVKQALKIIKTKQLGEVINLRGVYGKSKMVTSMHGWRAQRELSGGGILLDQGIHMVDLMRLFCGDFVEIKSFVNNDYWKHDVEDNAYAIMKDGNGRVAMLNSTATQWQHRFNLEISLTEGYIELHGILSGSKSYGEEKIIFGKRDENSNNGQMESKEIKFLEDNSWKNEIDEFIEAVLTDSTIVFGSSKDALETMKIVYGIYFNDTLWQKKYNIKNPNI
ncbi:Gfo/Idh/MocA family oxidoreductase [Flavobacteriaceae bacterium]|nr:Gfo/Idh/MocA family oxidoreductase [Flavobacteriaceae bacterium]